MTYPQSHAIGHSILDYLEREHAGVDPMEATAAIAIALGCAVATLNQTGLTKQGRAGHVLSHLFEIAESAAMAGASV
jgi:uncharacterized membrane protein (DUF441 family)